MDSNGPVGFDYRVICVRFLVMYSVPFDLIIIDPIQVKLRIQIDKYQSTVKARTQGKEETLNPQYEADLYDDPDYDFTSNVILKKKVKKTPMLLF